MKAGLAIKKDTIFRTIGLASQVELKPAPGFGKDWGSGL